MSLTDYIGKWPKAAILLTSIFFVLLIGSVDYLTGIEISFSIFFLAPIALACWFAGQKAGIGMSLLGALTWLLADIIGGHEYAHPIIPYWNALVRLGFFLVTVNILSKLKGAYEKEKIMAREDYLTGAYNSRAFYDLAKIENERAVRYRRPLTLAYIDVDNFKAVNDKLGHAVGDQLLRSLVEQMKKHVRPFDVIARMGGDEFAVLFPEAGEDSAGAMLERFVKEIKGVMEENESPITFSMGAVTYISPNDSVAEMLKKADSLMYLAKAGGKNTIRHEILDQGGKLSE